MSFLETNVGPVIGETDRLVELILKARDGALGDEDAVSFADFLNFGVSNTPYVNLFYTRVALDYLFLNSMREAASPGYLKRKEAYQRGQWGAENQELLTRKYHLKPFGK